MLLICNGMIRSGSTLQYNLVRNIVEELGVGEGIGFFSPEQIELKIHFLTERAVEKRYYVMKVHEKIPDALLYSENFENSKIFYTYRDIRDVAVSLKNKLNCEGDDLIKKLDHAIALSKEIRGYPNVLLQKYEEVYSDTKEAITAQVNYIGLDITDQSIGKISDACSINSIESNIGQGVSSWKNVVKRGLVRIGVLDGDYDQDTLIHSNHISKNRGRVGSWESQLLPDEKTKLTERYLSWLNEYGY